MHRGTSRTSAAHSQRLIHVSPESILESSHIRSHLIWRNEGRDEKLARAAEWPFAHVRDPFPAQGPLLNFRLLCVILVHNQLHSTPWGEREACCLPRCSRGMANAHHEEFEEFRSVFPRLETFSWTFRVTNSNQSDRFVRTVYLGGFDSASCQHAQFLTMYRTTGSRSYW
eukprot:COSAG02_NODE_20117_length_847_cov_29.378342_1_plen_170_part_00